MFTDEGKLTRWAKWGLALLALFTLGLIGQAYSPRLPEASAAERRQSATTYAATQACKDWTTNQSRVGVGEFTRDARLDDKKGAFTIVLNWRSQGIGLNMVSECRFVDRNGMFAMLRAKTGPAQ